MSEINFNQLKRLWNLKLVVQTGSIKKAAVRANVTSSALSQSITGLETELGRKLLIRNKDRILATEHGTRLLRDADSAFDVCFNLQQRLSGTCSFVPKMTWLDFAATESLALDVLPKIMKSLRAQLPHLRLKVRSGRSFVLTALVKKAELCMALVEENDFLEDVTTIPVATDRLGFFGSPRAANELGKKAFDKLGIAALSAGPEGHPLYFSKFIRTLGSGFKPTLTSESYEILRCAAVEGTVVSVLPNRVAARRLNELVEIFPSKEAEKIIRSSAYKICLISEPGCSSEENDFLANEIRSIVSANPSVRKEM